MNLSPTKYPVKVIIQGPGFIPKFQTGRELKKMEMFPVRNKKDRNFVNCTWDLHLKQFVKPLLLGCSFSSNFETDIQICTVT